VAITTIRRWALASGLCATLALAAACGGDDDEAGGVILAGTPLPTATFPIPTPPACDVENAVAPPDNFPTDVPFPPGYQLSLVETEPYLHIVGRIEVPQNAFIPEDARGFLPTTALEAAMLEAMKDDWAFTLNPVEGRDYNFEHADGRVGHFNIGLILECAFHASLTMDFPWITSDEAPPPPRATPTVAS
jgi:hypothetical protein